MAIKKSELYSSLWKSCDELRGGMDASQYKDYVLVLLFVKYVSDKYAGQPGALIEVPAGGSFADMVAYKGTKDQDLHKIVDAFNKQSAYCAVCPACPSRLLCINSPSLSRGGSGLGWGRLCIFR